MEAGDGIAALVVAAGSGSRAGGGVPKQFRPVAGRPLLAHAVEALRHDRIGRIQVVIGPGQEEAYREAVGEGALPAVTGGATRQQSVRNGLEALARGGGVARVLIHDAARPFLPAAVVERLLDALDDHAGAVPVLPVVDSLAHVHSPPWEQGGVRGGLVPTGPDSFENAPTPGPSLRAGRGDLLGDPVSRERLVRVQTPQAFRFADIVRAHACWRGGEATDDAQVARAAGLSVATVAGDPMLEKLTYEADFARAEARLAARLVPRTGFGFDVHALVAGEQLWLGGVLVPHEKGLAGHSDADVVLHALTDAILGALAAGDIGVHFPPSDPQWRGAASSLFLEHARDLVAQAGGQIVHADVTIICEAPRLAPYREAMRERIAAWLRLPLSGISVKATTTERLGFAGRGEGIAAQAVATVRLPEER